MWSIEMFPAAQGDSLWIEYGDDAATHRILVDGGTSPTYDHLRARLATLDPAVRRFELVVVTHVDADHIEGIVRLLGDRSMGVQVDDIWFNGWQHISDALGPLQGEYLSALIERAPATPWNAAFDEKAVMVPDGGPLPVRTLAGGMQLTLLSPRRQELGILASVWEREVTNEGLMAGDTGAAFERLLHDTRLRPPPDVLGAIDVVSLAEEPLTPDGSEANASSIVVLAEFEGAACLLGADGVTGVLDATVPRLLAERGASALSLDALKLPHHGSKHNVSVELLTSLPAKRYLFSTSGARFGHPDDVAVARVLVHGSNDPELAFNYRSEDNELWDDDDLRNAHGYRTRYPDAGNLGIRVDLLVE
jgi:hypothetical protein